jgi:hypothetical protein
MRPSLHNSGSEKLESPHLAVGREERLIAEDDNQEGHEDDDIYAVIEEKEKQERWDVETVLSESYHTDRMVDLSTLPKQRIRTLKTIHG